MNRSSQDAQNGCNWKDNIDVDGLNKVPIEPEDSVLSFINNLQKQNQSQNEITIKVTLEIIYFCYQQILSDERY